MDTLQFVDTTSIKVSARTREDFGDMEGLVDSIKDKGLLQPLLLNPALELRDGGRRYEACLRAGIKKIPCLIRKDADQLDAIEIELIANIARKDFTWQEQAKHTKKLQDYCLSKNIDWSGRKLAILLNGSQKTVQRQLALADAIDAVPELAKVRTQEEAEKIVKRLQEDIITGELRRRQEASKDTGLVDTLKSAKANYRIGDCFKGLAELKSNGFVHFIELDPPYGVDLPTQKGTGGKRTAGSNIDALHKQYNEVPFEEYQKFMTRMAKETYRVAAPHAWMICWHGCMNFDLVQKALRAGGWTVANVPGIWVKPNGEAPAPEYNLASCYEPFFVCRKGSPTLVKRGRSNVFQFGGVPPAQRYHPTQRPLDLMQELLSTFVMPRQIVLIPCLGSGVTLRASYLYGTSCFGYDLSPQYRDKFLLEVESDLKRLNGDK
jgi:ParB/RepB/Spo0J family partition protein